jgi:hypothetical protein
LFILKESIFQPCPRFLSFIPLSVRVLSSFVCLQQLQQHHQQLLVFLLPHRLCLILSDIEETPQGAKRKAPKFARKAWDIPCLHVLFILIKKSRQNTKNVETSWQVG